jgi:outer membrane protein
MKLRLFTLILALFVVTKIGLGQDIETKDTLKLSLKDAQNNALESNRTIKSSKIDVELAKQKVKEITGIGLPNITLSADYQHQFVVPEMSLGGYYDFTGIGSNQPVTGSDLTSAYKAMPPIQLGVKDNTTFKLVVSQLIFSGDYIVGLQASRVYKELSEQNEVSSELGIVETVSNIYYGLLAMKENLAILKESVLSLSNTVNEMNKMHEQGYTEDTEVDQMKINLSTIETTIIYIEVQSKLADQLLKIRMGMDINKPLMLTDSISGIINQADYPEEPVFDLQKSINYKMLETYESLMSLNLKREKWSFLPTIAGFYQHQQLLKEPALNFMPKDIIGISASIPIFTGWQRVSKIKQAQMNLEKAKLTKEETGDLLLIQFNTALNVYDNAKKTYITNKESMGLSKRIYDKSLIKYKEGIISSIDLTQNQNQYLTAQGNYFNSVLSFLSARAALDRILSTKNN